jgi:hypothetical protein
MHVVGRISPGRCIVASAFGCHTRMISNPSRRLVHKSRRLSPLRRLSGPRTSLCAFKYKFTVFASTLSTWWFCTKYTSHLIGPTVNTSRISSPKMTLWRRTGYGRHVVLWKIQGRSMNGLLVQHGAGGIENDRIFLTLIETCIYFMN